ncbi:MAG: histidine kinase [Pseudomonadota bacterium]
MLLRGELTEGTRMAIASSPLDKDVPLLAAHSDEADNRLIARIRLVLAASALLVAVVDHTGPGQAHAAPLAIIASYTAICAAAYVGVYFQLRWVMGTLMHRLDAGLFVAMAAANGEADIFPLMFLFFAMVVASLRYGLDEGARVILIAVVLYCALALAKLHHVPPARLFLRAAVLLAIGRAIAQLGERHLQAARRQALLRDLNQVANPRFGIDRTMTAALERTRAFFMADSCIVLLEADSGGCALRAVRAGGPPVAPAATVDAELARAMLPEPRTHVLLYACAWRRWRQLAITSLSHAGGPGCWIAQDQARLGALADLLEARSFISAPLAFGQGKGRIYVTAGARLLGRADALFLARIAAKELLAIDRIELLDRIASDAAALERKKIALDLHDTAIQSYIGLHLGLLALCRQAAPTNPLSGELDKLVAMAADVIVQLRDYAQGRCGEAAADEPICLAALRRQAAQALTAYGVEIAIEIEGRIDFGDRLSAEVLQIVREAISNICRHTSAKRAAVSLRCSGELLRIEINNEHGGNEPAPFRPHSISERAIALGGSVFVCQGRFNDTIVCVEIPL